MHDEEIRHIHHHRDRREIADRVVRQILVRACNYRIADARGEQGVTIRGRFGYEIAGYRAARARPVLDDHLLVYVLTELLREEARRDIHAARGRETDDDAHGFYRITLRTGILQRRDRCGRTND